jgi:hypothetical protein
MEQYNILPEFQNKALTRIQQMYTLSNTPEPDDDKVSEVDQIMVDNFIKTISEVALSIANRKNALKQEPD